MNNSLLLWLVAIALMTVATLQGCQLIELRKQNMILAVKLDSLEDRLNYQMQLIHKLQPAKPEHSGFRAEAKPFVMPENGTIEYTHPIYRIPEGNK